MRVGGLGEDLRGSELFVCVRRCLFRARVKGAVCNYAGGECSAVGVACDSSICALVGFWASG
jgi:hypothetical protein